MISNYILTVTSLYDEDKRISDVLIKAIMIWAVHIYIWCLVLSLFNSLSYWPLFILFVVSNLYMIIRLYINNGIKRIYQLYEQLREEIRGLISDIRTDRIDYALSLIIVAFVLIIGIIALFAVPYNYDSIDYHAPRICQWVQNHSVMYYASHVTRQNFSTVLASYIATVAYILTGRWQSAMCIIQYGAYVINLGLILHICRKLGIARRYKELAALLWITLPIGVAEAITPQNDQCATVWLLVFVVQLFALIEKTKENITEGLYTDILYIAVSIALGYLTKPSVCFAMMVFLIWYLVVCIRCKVKASSLVYQCMFAGAMIGILICPQMIQNYSLLGSLSADVVGKRQLVGTVKPNYLMVNMMKNITYNSAFRIGSISNTAMIKDLLYAIADVMKVDLNDATISEDGAEFYCANVPCYTSDAGIEFTLFLCAVTAYIIYIFKRKSVKSSENVVQFIRCSYISFIVLCIFLRWEGSVTRYMIGYFALIIIAFVCIIQSYLTYDSNHIMVVVGGCIIALFITLDIGYEVKELVRLHPVFPIKSTLTMYHDRLDEYEEVCNYINESGSEVVGLIEPESPVEYPLWRMLDDDITIIHVNLKDNNPLCSLERMDIYPDYILSSLNSEEKLICHEMTYNMVMYKDHWRLYEKDQDKICSLTR